MRRHAPEKKLTLWLTSAGGQEIADGVDVWNIMLAWCRVSGELEPSPQNTMRPVEICNFASSATYCFDGRCRQFAVNGNSPIQCELPLARPYHIISSQIVWNIYLLWNLLSKSRSFLELTLFFWLVLLIQTGKSLCCSPSWLVQSCVEYGLYCFLWVSQWQTSRCWSTLSCRSANGRSKRWIPSGCQVFCVYCERSF